MTFGYDENEMACCEDVQHARVWQHFGEVKNTQTYLLHVGFGGVEVLIGFLSMLCSFFCFSPLPLEALFTLYTKITSII